MYRFCVGSKVAFGTHLTFCSPLTGRASGASTAKALSCSTSAMIAAPMPLPLAEPSRLTIGELNVRSAAMYSGEGAWPQCCSLTRLRWGVCTNAGGCAEDHSKLARRYSSRALAFGLDEDEGVGRSRAETLKEMASSPALRPMTRRAEARAVVLEREGAVSRSSVAKLGVEPGPGRTLVRWSCSSTRKPASAFACV